jgi:hypothetical protein
MPQECTPDLRCTHDCRKRRYTNYRHPDSTGEESLSIYRHDLHVAHLLNSWDGP